MKLFFFKKEKRMYSCSFSKTVYMTLVCVTLPFCSINSFAQELDSITLERAISLTLKHNPTLYQYQIDQNILKKSREINALSPNYTVGLEVENFAGGEQFSGFDNAEASLQLSSILEMGNKKSARVALVDSKIDQLEIKKQIATAEVLRELNIAFINALATQYEIAIAQEAFNLAEDLYQTIESKAARGAAPEVDVMRAKASISKARLELDALQQQLLRQIHNMAQYWGESNASFDKLVGDIFHFTPTSPYQTLIEQMNNSHYAKFYAADAEVKNRYLELIKANTKNDIQWKIGIKHFSEFDESALAAGLTIPLNKPTLSRSKVEVAEAEREVVAYDERTAMLSFQAQIYSAYSLVQQNKSAILEMQQEALPSLFKVLELTKQGYMSGRYRYRDWVVAQDELLKAKQFQINAAREVHLNQLFIEKMTGALVKNN